jgi:bifunctional DNA-binding transcriptional regulator/antitoxin component of YhaV-PrlF toxin-antitoxin module
MEKRWCCDPTYSRVLELSQFPGDVMRTTRAAGPVTVHSFVGNLGCIRFPPTVRAAAGVKRGDRLVVSVTGARSILLEKLPVGLSPAQLEVEGCACEQVPGGCGGGDQQVLTVGWSYVQLGAELATALGFLPDRPLRLTASPSRIAVSVHRRRRDLAGVANVACPP